VFVVVGQAVSDDTYWLTVAATAVPSNATVASPTVDFGSTRSQDSGPQKSTKLPDHQAPGAALVRRHAPRRGGPGPAFRTRTAQLGTPVVNLDRALQVVAEIEDEEFLRKARIGK